MQTHKPQEPTVEKWEENLLKLHRYENDGKYVFDHGYDQDELIDFIRTLLSHSVQEAKAEMIEKIIKYQNGWVKENEDVAPEFGVIDDLLVSLKQEPTVEKWEIRFSKKFTDNILPGGYGNDLIIDKDDVEPLMKFIKKEITHSVQEAKAEVLKEIDNVASAGNVGEQTKLAFKWLKLELESRWHKLASLKQEENRVSEGSGKTPQ